MNTYELSTSKSTHAILSPENERPIINGSCHNIGQFLMLFDGVDLVHMMGVAGGVEFS